MSDENELTPTPEIEESLAESAEALSTDALSEPTEDLADASIPEIEMSPPPPADAPVDEQMYALLALETDGLDIDQALAAVASLSDVVAEREVEADRAEIAHAEAEAERDSQALPGDTFPRPPMMTLQRGQMASVIPALLLMLIGAWLTFTLTTNTAPLDTGLVIAIVAGSIGVTLLAQWLNSGRWASGALLAGTTTLLVGAAVFYLIQVSDPGFARGYPLLLAALGAALVITGLLAKPTRRRMALGGIAVIVAALAAFGVTTGAINNTVVNTLGSVWFIPVIVLIALWLLPVIQRKRP